MQELRVVALSEDGESIVLTSSADEAEGEYLVPVDTRLRAAMRGELGRLGQLAVRLESSLSPREIQARLRAGDTPEGVARAAGVPVDRIRAYAGPVLAERAHVVDEARGAGMPNDDRTLGEIVDERVGDGEWDAWRREDGTWAVHLTHARGRAEWTWDPVRRQVRPAGQEAGALLRGDDPAQAPPIPSGSGLADGPGDGSGGAAVTPITGRRAEVTASQPTAARDRPSAKDPLTQPDARPPREDRPGTGVPDAVPAPPPEIGTAVADAAPSADATARRTEPGHAADPATDAPEAERPTDAGTVGDEPRTSAATASGAGPGGADGDPGLRPDAPATAPRPVGPVRSTQRGDRSGRVAGSRSADHSGRGRGNDAEPDSGGTSGAERSPDREPARPARARRPRRASVPAWDDIVFGSRRPD